jgi:lysyl-tRNA synthetase class 2
MSALEEIQAVRLEKIEKLKAFGMDPYPSSVPRDTSLGDVVASFDELESKGESFSIAGRAMAIRGQGAILFIVLQEGADRFQVVLKKDEIDENIFKLFADTVDMGDFISVTGTLFITKRGEQSLLIKDWKMATKSLAPLPEKWAGLVDTDERYRKRYLELLSDQDTYDRFTLRTRVIKAIRSYFDDKGFIEIETPVLKLKAGGAMAKPFTTHHNDLGIDMKLRISLEIEHKMLMAGGFPAVYEIGKNFRNEGSDPTHIQEFTMMEWYAAYRTLDENIAWTEELLKKLANDVVGKNKFNVHDKDGNGVEVSFEGDWQRKKFSELLQEYAGVDMITISDGDLQKEVGKYGLDSKEAAKTSRANLLDFVYKHTARAKLIDPTFVTHYPGDLKPLAQQNEDGTAQVAQLIIGGAEITNQYAELVNPIAQRALLEKQSAAKSAGDEEAMELDEDFITAMEHGMPPMTGFGMGIDRLIAIFASQKNIRDTIFFPIMKPKEDQFSKKQAEAMYKSKKIIVISDPKLGYGVTANAMAQLGISIGGFTDEKIFGVTRLPDASGNNHYPDGFYGMTNLAGDQKVMAEFVTKCYDKNIQLFDFSDIMRKAHTDKQMLEGYKKEKTEDINYIAVGAVVPAGFEKDFLSGLELFG